MAVELHERRGSAPLSAPLQKRIIHICATIVRENSLFDIEDFCFLRSSFSDFNSDPECVGRAAVNVSILPLQLRLWVLDPGENGQNSLQFLSQLSVIRLITRLPHRTSYLSLSPSPSSFCTVIQQDLSFDKPTSSSRA